MSGDQALFDFPGLPPTPPEPAPKLSAGARLTARQHADVARGVHPLTNGPARPERGTCGDCAHRLGGDRKYPKCELGPITRGPQTDVRAWWPACDRHQPRP